MMRRARPLRCAIAACVLPVVVGGAGAAASPPSEPPSARSGRAAVLLFAGDVMLGRGVAHAREDAGNALFADVREVVAAADLTAANLESPLTRRPHDPAAGPNALEAPPAAARLLAAAGFDAMAIANNHAGDAGPATPADTARALRAAGVLALGRATPRDPAGLRVVTVAGVRVALLAFDTTGRGPAGVARWDAARAKAAVARARSRADVVTVALHGGAEYVPVTDPYLMRLARLLGGWGVDVVWAHGPHVVQPVRTIDPDRDGRATVVATSLGNLLFDQHLPGTRRGALLEVIVRRDGVRAFRVGTTDHGDGRVHFVRWSAPRRPAVALEGEWWTAAGRPHAAPPRPVPVRAGFQGDVTAAVLGDPDGDGRDDLVVAFRRLFTRTAVNELIPRRALIDPQGRSAHVGLYDPRDLRPRWVAGTLLRPVAALAACDRSLAVAYASLGGGKIQAAGAWEWGGFGFVTLPDLPGAGEPRCADVDGDGHLDPLILERS